MTHKDFQNAFGQTPDSFRTGLSETLNQLEEKKVKKFSTVLIAAALCAVLLAGAAFAASEMGVFDMLTHTADPIVPLDGADEMVQTNLGSSENELVTMTVEQAVFDGYGAIVQIRVTPKDPAKYALFNEMLQDYPDDVYTFETGEDERSLTITGRKDGKAMINYWPHFQADFDDKDAEAQGLPNYFDTMRAEEQEDGSLLIWAQGAPQSSEMLAAMTVTIELDVSLAGETLPMDAVSFPLTRPDDMRQISLTPVGEGTGDRFQVYSVRVIFTRMQAYLYIDYTYTPVSEDDMGIDFHVFGADSAILAQGDGCTDTDTDENGQIVYHQFGTMQSLDSLPDMLTLEAKVIGEDKILGQVECSVSGN